MADTILSNSSYLFIPFRFGKDDNYVNLLNSICHEKKWELYIDKNEYMFKYVFDRISSPSLHKTASAHFVLTEAGASTVGITLGEKCSFAQKQKEYGFTLDGVHMFLFNTSVGILAFRITFDSSDPFVISSAQYHMKKVYTQTIKCGIEFTFTGLSKALLSDFFGSELNLFFYAEEGKGRANFFTYLENNGLNVADKKSYEKELFFLKGCYHDGFEFSDAVEDAYSESYVAAHDKVWGISPNAAVCLTNAESTKKEFNRTTFFSNFNTHYLLMYVLLLHQRYVTYMFLTDVSSSENDMEKLESYKQRFADFENTFIFAEVTDVPQYQQLYKKIERVFSLKELRQDVTEPIRLLAELREKEEDREEMQSEKSMNSALTAISLLTVISAITDAISIVMTVKGGAHPIVTAVISAALILLIGGAVGWFIGHKPKEKKKKAVSDR